MGGELLVFGGNVGGEPLAFGGKLGGELLVFGVNVGGELLVFGGKARLGCLGGVCEISARFAARDVVRESAVFYSDLISDGICRAFPPIALLLCGSDSSGLSRVANSLSKLNEAFQ